MTEGIDWIARAGAKAKGRRPEFHDAPAIDRLLSLTMALVGEVSVLRERMDTVERLLEAKGSISQADIDAWLPDAAAAAERGLATRAYIARVMRGFQQEVEAMENPDPPVMEWVENLARSGIILLLPLGLHMGHLYGLQPFGGGYLTIMWLVIAAWMALCWAAFFKRETDAGLRLTKIDEAVRYVLIPAILVAGISSLLGNGPFVADEGVRWYAWKFTLYGFTLCIGLGLRWIMRSWTTRFRELAAGPNPSAQARLEREIGYGRMMAYVYWITIAGICYLGTVKPV